MPVSSFTSNVNYAWAFGDGDSSYAKSPEHTFASGGLYYVCLSVTNPSRSCIVINCDSIIVGSSGLRIDPKQVENAKFYPNPFDDKLTIELNSADAGKVRVVFYDVAGREHYNKEYILNRSVNMIEISTELLPKGIYVIRLERENHSFFRKFVKLKYISPTFLPPSSY
jgi:PKD repeat protein